MVRRIEAKREAPGDEAAAVWLRRVRMHLRVTTRDVPEAVEELARDRRAVHAAVQPLEDAGRPAPELARAARDVLAERGRFWGLVAEFDRDLA